MHFEPRFNQDFGSVRVHTDGQAAEAAEGIGARAYTLGEHVVFGAGEFAPASGAGQHLLAHELAHVVQQRAGVNASGDATVQRVPAPPEPTEHVGTSLWAKNAAGHDLQPSLEDIVQGELADCYLFAALGAIVVTDPNKIRHMITDNGDGTYTVRFHGIGHFSDATQTVTADFVQHKHGQAGRRGAFWPLVIEKAYAKQKGGLDKIGHGGWPGVVIDDLTNVSASTFDPREETVEYIMAKLTQAHVKKVARDLDLAEARGCER